MKSWVVVVIGVLCIGGALFFLTRTSSTPPPSQEAAGASGGGVVGAAEGSTDPYDVLISFTDDGFMPKTVTVQKGTRVRFINESTQTVWPASNIHPTHTLYPEKEAGNCLGSSFDACRGLVPGEFFAFTFNHVGEWRYHDHDHAYHTGVITVTE